MAMDRSEQTGLAVAIAAHVLLFALLSLSFGSQPDRRFDNPPMAVDIIAEVAPESVSPKPEAAEPAARLGEPDAVEDALPPPAPPITQPVTRPDPVPPKRAAPTPAPRPTPRAAPPERRPPPPRAQPEAPKQRAAPPRPVRQPAQTPPRRPPARPVADPRPSGALDGIAGAVAREANRGPAVTPPAARSGTEIRRSISTSINAAVRQPWNACRVTGIDVDQLKTTVVFRLTEAGGLERIASVSTSGVNDSNRPQQQRFEECARRAIALAAPFDLPRENYSYWQTYTLDFEKR